MPDIIPSHEDLHTCLATAFEALSAFPETFAPVAHALYAAANTLLPFHPAHADADESFLALGLARLETVRGLDAVAYAGRDYDPATGSHALPARPMSSILSNAAFAGALACPDVFDSDPAPVHTDGACDDEGE